MTEYAEQARIQVVVARDVPAEVWSELELTGEPVPVTAEEAEALAIGDVLVVVLHDQSSEWSRESFVVEALEGERVLARWLQRPDLVFEFDRPFVSEMVVSILPKILFAALGGSPIDLSST